MAKQKFDYFNSFIAQTEVALEEAHLLERIIENFTSAADLHDDLVEAHAIEHKGDLLSHEVNDNVAIDFITPFEREDILHLSQGLDSITDQIEDVIQSFYMFDVHVMRPDAADFCAVIIKSLEALHEAVLEFRDYKKSTGLKQRIITVNDCEEEGDRLYLRAMHTLYVEEREIPMRVQVWSQLYYRLEKATDLCEHAADLMGNVVLKNS